MSYLLDYALLPKCKPRVGGGGEGGAGHEFVHYGIGNKRSERQKEETDICKIRKFGVD